MHEQIATYNGWSNRETWLANLWLTNVQQSYNVPMDAIAVPAPVYGYRVSP